METGVELDFTIDWARSAKAEASSAFKVVLGGGTVEEEGFRAGVPVGVRWPSDITSGSGKGLNHFLNGGVWKTRFRGVEGAGWVHWCGKTSS